MTIARARKSALDTSTASASKMVGLRPLPSPRSYGCCRQRVQRRLDHFRVLATRRQLRQQRAPVVPSLVRGDASCAAAMPRYHSTSGCPDRWPRRASAARSPAAAVCRSGRGRCSRARTSCSGIETSSGFKARRLVVRIGGLVRLMQHGIGAAQAQPAIQVRSDRPACFAARLATMPRIIACRCASVIFAASATALASGAPAGWRAACLAPVPAPGYPRPAPPRRSSGRSAPAAVNRPAVRPAAPADRRSPCVARPPASRRSRGNSAAIPLLGSAFSSCWNAASAAGVTVPPACITSTSAWSPRTSGTGLAQVHGMAVGGLGLVPAGSASTGCGHTAARPAASDGFCFSFAASASVACCSEDRPVGRLREFRLAAGERLIRQPGAPSHR